MKNRNIDLCGYKFLSSFLPLRLCAFAPLRDKMERNFTYFPEQQKIADCLSSLDDLITAQTKKIEALKTHKKALMQGLFPATGQQSTHGYTEEGK